MNSSASISGGCLCGTVRYEAQEQFGGGHCHCVDCRKTSGTAHGSHMIVPEPAFTMTGNLSWYSAKADSGNDVKRGFCPTCGSAIYSTNSGMPGMVFVRASSLDDPEHFQPQMVVYDKRAPSWDKLDPALPHFEGMPPPDAMANMNK